MSTQCPLHIGEVSWKYLKGFQSYGPHKILQFWELWEITPEPSQLELSFLHAPLLPNARYNLTKFHENSSKGIGVMGRTWFRLQKDRQMDGRAITISPQPIGRGIKNRQATYLKLWKIWDCINVWMHRVSKSLLFPFTLKGMNKISR